MCIQATSSRNIVLCIIFALLIVTTVAKTNAPNWSTLSDVQTNTLNIITSGTSHGEYFESSYSTPFSQAPNAGLAVSHMDTITNTPTIAWKAVLIQTNRTHITIKAEYTKMTFKSMKVSYLAVSKNLDYLKFDYLEITQGSLGPISTGTGLRSVYRAKNLGVQLNKMNRISVVSYISGLRIASKNSERAFSLEITIKNENSIYWNATCFGSTTVSEIAASLLFYDNTIEEKTGDILIDYRSITGNHNLRDPVSLPSADAATVLVGVSSFHFVNGFSYNIDPSTLGLTLPAADTFLATINFSFWSLRKRNCAASTPYFEKSSNLCFDSCPTEFLLVDAPKNACEKCSSLIPNCLECESKEICNQCTTGYKISQNRGACQKQGILKSLRNLQSPCPTGTFMSEGLCHVICPWDMWGNHNTGLCQWSCPSGTFGNPNTMTCQNQCPAPLFGDIMSRKCVNQCQPGFLTVPATRQCVLDCPTGFFAQSQTSMCVSVCPTGYFANNMTNACATRCSGGVFGDKNTNTCVQECPTGFFADEMTFMCETRCTTPLYGDLLTKRCVYQCPPDYFADFASSLCVQECPAPLFGDRIVIACVTSCPYNQFGDNLTRKCVKACPASASTYGSYDTKLCVKQCPDGSYADDQSRTCVHLCGGETVGDDVTKRCVKVCPTTSYADLNLRKCVAVCPVWFYGQKIKRTCVTDCPASIRFRQNNTRTCVSSCIGHQDSYADKSTGFCAERCQSGTWGNPISQACVWTCPSGYFGNNNTNLCVTICPVPYYGDLITKACSHFCPPLYLQNQPQRTCESSCPTGLLIDQINNQCVSECQTGYFASIESGACVTNCLQPKFGDPESKKCIQKCNEGFYGSPPMHRTCVNTSIFCTPMYGQNSTRECVDICPNNTWANNFMFRCDACDTICKNCYGPTSYNCTECYDAFYLSPATNECLACDLQCVTCSTATQCLSCHDGFYLSPTNQCTLCPKGCTTCIPNNCTSCEADRVMNYTSTSFSCVCMTGAEDAQGNCVTAVRACADTGCKSCPNDQNLCEQCKPSFILTSGKCSCPQSKYLHNTTTQYTWTLDRCQNCHPLCLSCTGPSQNECLECNPQQNRQINQTTRACDCILSFYAPNNESVCIKEPKSACPENFVHDPTGVFCVEACGDGKLFELECDDGNLENGDGCDYTCQVEDNFTCFNNKTDEPTICSYSGEIIFELIYAEKDPFGNIIKMEYRIFPQLKFFEMFPDFSSTLKIAESAIKTQGSRQIPKTASDATPSFNILSALYSSSSKTLLVDVGYTKTATGKTVRISYTPTESPYSASMSETSYEWSVKVSNGLSLIYYPQEIYSQAKSYNSLTMAIYFGSLGLFVLALLFRKMIGVEMIVLVQTQVLSLSMLSQIHPTLGVLTQDKYAFGYNLFHELMDFKTKGVSESVGLYEAIGFTSVFGENVNIMLFVICFFYLLALVIRLVATRKQNESGQRIKKVAALFARQISFGFLLFSLMNMVTSYVLEVYAGSISQFSPEYSGVIKILSIIIIIANYVVYGIYFKDIADSLVFYARTSKISQIQPLFIATKTILIALGIALYHQFGLPALYVLMGLQGAYIIMVILLRPFNLKIDLVRSVVLESSLLYVIVSRYILIGHVHLEYPEGWAGFLESGLTAEHAVIGLSLLLSFVSFIFHLFTTNSKINPEEDYSQNGDGVRKPKQNKIYDYGQGFSPSKGGLANNSMTQLISTSQGEGYDSKRKLKNSNMVKTMEIIEMDQ